MTDHPAVVYLAGPIDLAPDRGEGWRRHIADFLRAQGCVAADPSQMQKSVVGLDVQALLALRGTDVERFKDQTRRVIEYDLGFIAERATCVVAMVDEHARMGTYAELTVAFLHRVPIFVVCPDRAQLSGWTLSCADLVFEHLNELIEWLSHEAGSDRSLPARLLRRREDARRRRIGNEPKH